MSTLVATNIASDENRSDIVAWNLAELVHRLGDIPLERIRMHPAPGTAVEKDVIALRSCELIDGVVMEKAMSDFESRLGAILIWVIESYLAKTRLGFVVGADAQTRMSPGRIRIPDVSFSRWERTSDGRVPTEPIEPFAPDLAVEILSPENTKQEMIEKRRDHFGAGTRLVWIVDSKSRIFSVYRDVDEFRVIEADGVIDGEDVLPGFTLKISEWFEMASSGQRIEIK